jgi:hypothetical protein
VGGGSSNTASGSSATVPGGRRNAAAGNSSFAAGESAQANHRGAFVWADSSDHDFFPGFVLDFASTAADEFSVRATGGVRFVTAIDGTTGAPTAGVTLAPGSGTWSSLSDRNAKSQITRISGRTVLRKLASVPISTWSYDAQDPGIRHIGPMAQDFFRSFGVGEDRRHISSVDADGVALAAIKGLDRKMDQRIGALEAKVGGGHAAGANRGPEAAAQTAPATPSPSLPPALLIALAMTLVMLAGALGAVLALRWSARSGARPATS